MNRKVYTIKDDKIVVYFEDLNERLKKLARHVRKHTKSSRMQKIGIAAGLAGETAALTIFPQGIVSPEGVFFFGGGSLLGLGSASKLETNLKEIKKAYETASKVMEKKGILNKNTPIKGHYGIDLSSQNQRTVKKFYPGFTFDEKMNLVLLKQTTIEKIRQKFQKRTGFAFFGKWRGRTGKEKSSKTKLTHNRKPTRLHIK
ncbi:hypothetical protein KKG83_05695 [Candidatus Micrarchaeota archaeon]|nr:hypothetical protein [Candidatus Micrarchaeota archaeon]MBU2476937.1 hypothetical protein [Candidatus Micrarchaeota archaeon]